MTAPARTPKKASARAAKATSARAAKKTPARTPKKMSDADLERLLALADDADSVELKLTVDEAHRWSTLTALDMDPLDARIRQVFFFDTPDLTLDKAGVVVRARRTQGKGEDSVIKLRPVVPADMPEELRRSNDFVVEIDAMPGGFVCSGSLKGKIGVGSVKPTVAGDGPIRKLFSKAQRAFFAQHAPDGIELDDLVPLGPINVLKLKFAPAGFSRRLAVELWLYPDGSRILELSTRCSTREPFQAAAEAKAYLAGRGVEMGDSAQTTKTRKALAYFSKQLADSPG
jgi:hypothetical protein